MMINFNALFTNVNYCSKICSLHDQREITSVENSLAAANVSLCTCGLSVFIVTQIFFNSRNLTSWRFSRPRS